MRISINNLSYTYRTERSLRIKALQNIDFHVNEKERLSIVGPSGAGKTTLLRVVAGLLPPGEGIVKLDDQRPMHAWRSGKLGFVFQEPNLLPWRTVAENIRLPFEVLGRTSEADSAVQHWLVTVGLAEFRDSYPDELSGGMRSRVAVARSVVTSPSLLLMDEPFNGLDELVAQTVMEQVANILSSLDASLLFVSHNILQAVFMADRILVLSARPAVVVADIKVPLSWPRSSHTLALPQFADITNEVRSHLFRSANTTRVMP